MTDIFETREAYSRERLRELGEHIVSATSHIELSDLAIFTVGSYGRLEASNHSDIDLFFVRGPGNPRVDRRTNELRLFGRLIDVVAELGFPVLSNDARYLQSHSSRKVLKHMGSAVDDSRNYFTTRMLLLLESRCIQGDASYAQLIDEILWAYYRDFPTHQEDFRPWYLLNDIMRYWNTLLVNYENKRNRRPSDGDLRPRVRNFKLKFSRLTTCFATVCAIGSSRLPTNVETLKEIVSITPRQRLIRVTDDIPALTPSVDRILDVYAWFLEQTALSTSELEDKFQSRAQRTEMFEKASDYRALFYDLLLEIDARGKESLLRALVI